MAKSSKKKAVTKKKVAPKKTVKKAAKKAAKKTTKKVAPMKKVEVAETPVVELDSTLFTEPSNDSTPTD